MCYLFIYFTKCNGLFAMTFLNFDYTVLDFFVGFFLGPFQVLGQAKVKMSGYLTYLTDQFFLETSQR